MLAHTNARTHTRTHTRDARFLQQSPEELQGFASLFYHTPLKRQTVITCMTTLHKSHPDSTSISCLVIGTEHKDVYILDPEAFTILAKARMGVAAGMGIAFALLRSFYAPSVLVSHPPTHSHSFTLTTPPIPSPHPHLTSVR